LSSGFALELTSHLLRIERFLIDRVSLSMARSSQSPGLLEDGQPSIGEPLSALSFVYIVENSCSGVSRLKPLPLLRVTNPNSLLVPNQSLNVFVGFSKFLAFFGQADAEFGSKVAAQIGCLKLCRNHARCVKHYVCVLFVHVAFT